ncbi:MAG: cation:proton antiporter [Candidatus Brocadiaceae bacterium]|nr:cation:proton antiporter [Candidatus Brocadiaceae bacterium]
MRTFKYNMAFVIVLISFYCSVAIGSPPLGAEYSAPSKDSEPIRIDIKNETESLFIEETLSPKKYLKRYLENAKKEGFPEKSPDREHQPIVVEKEAPSTAGEKDAHPTVDKEQPLVVEEKGTQTPAVVDNMIPPSINGEAPSSTVPVEEKGYQEKSLTDEGHQPIVSFPETFHEAKEESTPMPTATPELHSGTIAEEKSLPLEAEGTQTPAVDNKFHLPADENGSSFPSTEESSYTATERGSEVLIKEAEEPEKGISSPEPPAETVKEAEDSKPAWDIWHKDPTHNVLLAVAIILIAAKIAGWMARMLQLPEVVGKLIIGMILGNVFAFTGWDFFDFLRTMPFIKMISYFGTLLLLFTAGLNTDLRALLRVGTSSFLVCLGGIIVPAGLGLMVGHFLLPDTSSGTKLLLAIILCNTGMGLLMVILRELKAMNTPEGRILIGAAVLTEIIVILTFGVVSEFAARGGVSFIGMSVSFGIAITSLIISLITILRYGEKFGNFLTSRMTEGMNIPILVILSLLLAFLFGSVGLHTVIGAFIAGLFLRNVKSRDSDDGEHRTIESFIKPFYMLLVPILFVRVGAQVELESFLNLNAVLLGLAITGVAVIGKMFCSVCPIEKGINRLAIGIGMATKMEGTLILSGIGRDIGMLNDAVFSSIIMVIVLTSTICPSLLRLSLRKKGVHRKGLHIAAEKKELEEVTLN